MNDTFTLSREEIEELISQDLSEQTRKLQTTIKKIEIQSKNKSIYVSPFKIVFVLLLFGYMIVSGIQSISELFVDVKAEADVIYDSDSRTVITPEVLEPNPDVENTKEIVQNTIDKLIANPQVLEQMIESGQLTPEAIKALALTPVVLGKVMNDIMSDELIEALRQEDISNETILALAEQGVSLDKIVRISKNSIDPAILSKLIEQTLQTPTIIIKKERIVSQQERSNIKIVNNTKDIHKRNTLQLRVEPDTKKIERKQHRFFINTMDYLHPELSKEQLGEMYNTYKWLRSTGQNKDDAIHGAFKRYMDVSRVVQTEESRTLLQSINGFTLML
jgi:hypothetical protein